MNHSFASPPEPVDCLKCRHFQVTWETDHPRGCRAMGFKTALWPWQEVLRSSGESCLRFESKIPPKKEGKSAEKGQNVAPSGRFSRVI
ncbi:MAG: hypothetical protein H7839_07180 [Magnetococcus sp. YQC-5]